MALRKTTVSWPITGGLETKIAPLAVQPGSHLVLDNVNQERLSEWRRRNGTTQVAADTVPQAACPPFASNLGPTGMFAEDWRQTAVYRPTQTSGRWGTATTTTLAQDIARATGVSIKTTNASSQRCFGFAQGGGMQMIAFRYQSAGIGTFTVFDLAGGTATTTSIPSAGSGIHRMRCVATSTHLVCIFSDLTGAGNLKVYVVTAATGAITGPTTIKTGLVSASHNLDAHWYGGATVSIVAEMAAGGFQLLEFNPSTGALATDANTAATADLCLSLIADPSASGVRWVAVSTAGGTSLLALTSSGGLPISAMTVEAVASTQITGCIGASAGSNSDWALIYQRATTPGLRVNSKVSGVIGTPGFFRGSVAPTGADLTIDSMGWGEPNGTKWHVIIGAHSTDLADAQDTYVQFNMNFGATVTTSDGDAAIVPLQAGAPPTPANFAAQDMPLAQVARTGTRTFQFVLPVVSHYANEGGTVTRDVSLDIFTQRLLGSDDIGATNTGRCLPYKQLTYIPTGSLRYSDADGQTHPLGLFAPPLAPTLVETTGGGMTALATYGFVKVIELLDDGGNIWRSPPSVPRLITLTGANNAVTITSPEWLVEDRFPALVSRVVLYRTQANGSKYRRVLTGSEADSAVVNGDILYTTGEAPTAITPRASHVFMHDDRQWLINADFRTEVCYTKNLRPGRQPEYTNEGVLDIDDEFGDLTGGCSIEGRGVLFKRNAIYFIQGEGFTDSGSGQNYTVTRVSQDIGAIAGSPIVVAGDTVYFVSERGIYSIDVQAQVKFAGAGVDQYLNQPLVQTQEAVFDGCFVPLSNEVRFVTTNYILVWNRTFNTWTRWTGLSGMKRCLVINGRMVLFRASDGTAWREGDHTQTTDQGVAFTGLLRSAWIRAAGDFGQFALWRCMATATRTAGGGNITPTMQVFTDDSDTQAQAFTSAVIAGATGVVHMEARPQVKNVSSFSEQITLPSGDATFRIEKLGAEVGIRQGAQKRPASERWA